MRCTRAVGLLVSTLSLAAGSALTQPISAFQNIETDRSTSAETIAGSVVDAENNPVQHALLVISHAVAEGTFEQRCVVGSSGEDGSFQLQLPQPAAGEIAMSPRVLWCYSSDHELAMKLIAAGENEEPLRIKLLPKTKTEFRVRSPDNKPIADAFVEPVQLKDKQLIFGVPPQILEVLAARTDTIGWVAFPNLSPSAVIRLRVTAKGYGVQLKDLNRPLAFDDQRDRIELRPAGQIRGRFIGHDPKSAVRMKLALTSTDSQGGAGIAEPTEGYAEASIDAFGRFRIYELAEGTVRIIATETGNQRPKLPRSFRVRAGETVDLELLMQEAVKIGVTLMSEGDGQVLPGIEVKISHNQGQEIEWAISDALGTIQAEVLTGEVHLYLENLSDQLIQLARPHRLEVTADGDHHYQLVVGRAEPREGRIESADGSGLANARITAYHEGWICSSAVSDDQGWFKLPRMPATKTAKEVTFVIELADKTKILNAQVADDDSLVLSIDWPMR